uniref:Uncharacterized protein n=1 Tax=Photinus pyralis TaxID=7054 RepID=A0A1Y1MXS8_PHOPY
MIFTPTSMADMVMDKVVLAAAAAMKTVAEAVVHLIEAWAVVLEEVAETEETEMGVEVEVAVAAADDSTVAAADHHVEEVQWEEAIEASMTEVWEEEEEVAAAVVAVVVSEVVPPEA